MQKQAFTTLLASAAILGSSMVGCSGANLEHRPALTVAQAPSLGQRVEKALESKDFARALMQAEELVAAAPEDAAYRALLGRAYLANGRYASARTAFNDAVTLGNRDPRTIISLSMAETGLGNAHGARDLLADHIADLPAADYGLAMTMAGNPQEGVRALLEAVKQPEATAQTRQNLAYALALGGAWGQARLIAGQDLSAREAEQRIGQWSQLRTEQQRVFAMIGVSPRDDDAGQPERLALGSGTKATDEPVQVAAASTDLVAQARADVAALPAVADRAAMPVEVASATIAPAVPAPAVQAASAPVSDVVATPSVKTLSPDTLAVAAAFASNETSNVPLIRASSDPMRQAARAAFQRSSTDTKALMGRASMSRVATVTTRVSDAVASDWVVQIGAYESVAVAKEKWERISRGRKALGEFNEIHSAFSLNGHAFHRLAIRGFGDREAAWQTCQSLRAEGQACFVRLDDTNTTRMARAEARKGQQQVASRKVRVGYQFAAR